MSNYAGVIIEESLEKKDVLKALNIIKTVVEKVTPEHETPYLKQWTLHTVEISESDIENVVEMISKSLDTVHADWYADFKNEKYHYIVFLNKVFKVDRAKPQEYEAVKKYGLKLGIPEHQLDFVG